MEVALARGAVAGEGGRHLPRCPCSCAARASPSATGSIAPRWLIMPTMRLLEQRRSGTCGRGPPVNPPSLPKSWRKSRAEVDPAGGEHAQVAVHGQDPVVGVERGGDADRDRLLAHAREPLRQLALAQQQQRLLLDQARQQERAVQLAQALRGEPGRDGGGVPMRTTDPLTTGRPRSVSSMNSSMQPAQVAQQRAVGDAVARARVHHHPERLARLLQRVREAATSSAGARCRRWRRG